MFQIFPIFDRIFLLISWLNDCLWSIVYVYKYLVTTVSNCVVVTSTPGSHGGIRRANSAGRGLNRPHQLSKMCCLRNETCIPVSTAESPCYSPVTPLLRYCYIPVGSFIGLFSSAESKITPNSISLVYFQVANWFFYFLCLFIFLLLTQIIVLHFVVANSFYYHLCMSLD